MEDGIVSFLKEKERVAKLNESATQAQRAVEISTTQYKIGRVSFQPVVYMQQILALRQDELAKSRGTVAINLVSIYKALGGGWETRMDAAGMPLDAVEPRLMMQAKPRSTTQARMWLRQRTRLP